MRVLDAHLWISLSFFRALVSTPAFWFLHHVSHNPTWEYGMPIGTPLLRLESTQTRVPGWGRVRGGYSVVVFKVWYMASSRRAQQVVCSRRLFSYQAL
ncbi:Protein of unknown function [Pyronema omphalodes CBS 100304]|uniref:Uncharacterized protein n=1 Tax=Pyronema omphalodes (strain CBS 100304) TaxID=1076935 RepID=U4LQV7_PYROM|nr:Protein of unknown function [Pyronema omphalodes CBS 100304]